MANVLKGIFFKTFHLIILPEQTEVNIPEIDTAQQLSLRSL